MKHALLFAMFAVSAVICLAQIPTVQPNTTRNQVSAAFSPSDLMAQPTQKAEEHSQGVVLTALLRLSCAAITTIGRLVYGQTPCFNTKQSRTL